ncbi:MAG: glucose dehydrogenase [Ideonella sp. MAG2]|nr:MAG: glucose dehydrogenase [Ideonella sp. MAG2]
MNRQHPLLALCLVAAVFLSGCTGAAPGAVAASTPAASVRINTLNSGLNQPWALAHLPGGGMLVTEKQGSLRRLSADGRQVLATISGVPTVHARGQGGLLDILLSPDFARSGELYLSYSEPGSGAEAGLSGTAIFKARLQGDALVGGQVIYRQSPKVSGSGHYGSRMLTGPDGYLWVSLGERQKESPAQDLTGSLGKIIRLRPDGQAAPDNPGWPAGSRPEIWSLGHRNPQGMAFHPNTGELWATEHGPQGGDELNRIRKGGNYGWPLRSYGCPYGSPVGEACRIGGGKHAPDFLEPVATWVPTSIAPSGLLFYGGERFAEWQGHAFVPGLGGQSVWRIVLKGDTEVHRDEPFGRLGERIRHISQGPDGWIYLLSDSGKLLRVER